MNRLLVTSLIFVCSYSLAHEPYVAPLAYKTEQTQVPDARRDKFGFFEIITFLSRCTLCKIISNIKH